MGRTPRRWCSPATTTVSARARTRRRTASRSAAACRTAASPSTSRCPSTMPCGAASWPRSSRARRNEFRLMSVHLKSGCPAGPLTAEGRNCDAALAAGGAAQGLDRGRSARRSPLRRARRFQSPLHAREGAVARRRGSPAERLRRDQLIDAARRAAHQRHRAREVHAVHHGQ